MPDVVEGAFFLGVKKDAGSGGVAGGGGVLGVRFWQLLRWWSLFLFYFSRVSARLLCFSLCFELHRSACGRWSGAFVGCASIAT